MPSEPSQVQAVILHYGQVPGAVGTQNLHHQISVQLWNHIVFQDRLIDWAFHSSLKETQLSNPCRRHGIMMAYQIISDGGNFMFKFNAALVLSLPSPPPYFAVVVSKFSADITLIRIDRILNQKLTLLTIQQQSIPSSLWPNSVFSDTVWHWEEAR